MLLSRLLLPVAALDEDNASAVPVDGMMAEGANDSTTKTMRSRNLTDFATTNMNLVVASLKSGSLQNCCLSSCHGRYSNTADRCVYNCSYEYLASR